MTERQVKTTIRISSALLAGAVLLSIPVVPLSRPLQQMLVPFTLIPIDEIITERPPLPRPRRMNVGELSATSMPAPYFPPSPVSAETSVYVVMWPGTPTSMTRSLRKTPFGQALSISIVFAA